MQIRCESGIGVACLGLQKKSHADGQGEPTSAARVGGGDLFFWPLCMQGFHDYKWFFVFELRLWSPHVPHTASPCHAEKTGRLITRCVPYICPLPWLVGMSGILLHGLMRFSFCRRLQNHTRITSFSMFSCSAITRISSEVGFWFWMAQ